MEKTQIISRVRNFISENNLLSPGETLVVGVSGGADSVCLLCLLLELQREFAVRLHIAHLDHQLRGPDSAADAGYVADLARRLNVPATIEKRDVAACKEKYHYSLEEAARQVRHKFFAHAAMQAGAQKVALGHTRDDQVETILMHILRGSGTLGLRGLEPLSPLGKIPLHHTSLAAGITVNSQEEPDTITIVRPLLEVTREETTFFCSARHIEARSDASNFSLAFLRNRLRLELLPCLRKYNPGVDHALLRLAEISSADTAFIEENAWRIWKKITREEQETVYLDKNTLIRLPIAMQRQLLKMAIASVLGNTRDIEMKHIESIRQMAAGQTGKHLTLPHKLVCRSSYREIAVFRSSCPSLPWPCPFSPLQEEIVIKIPGETVLPGWRIVSSIIPKQIVNNIGPFVAELDYDRAGNKLLVRQRRPGDRFQPLGMSTTKKLQDFMVNAKIPLHWREYVPLVCSQEHILWVAGWRIDERYKITAGTRQILRLEFSEMS